MTEPKDPLDSGKGYRPAEMLMNSKDFDDIADCIRQGRPSPRVPSGQVHSQLQRGFGDGILLLVAKDYALFEELETVARITAMRHAIITDPRIKAMQVTWLQKMEGRRAAKNVLIREAYEDGRRTAAALNLTPEQQAEFRKRFNSLGTRTGRISCTKPNLSNPPRSAAKLIADVIIGMRVDGITLCPECAMEVPIQGTPITKDRPALPYYCSMCTKRLRKEEPMETLVGDTIVKTGPDLVEIDCGSGKDGCQHCGPKRKEKIHGRRAEIITKIPGKNTKVKVVDGEHHGKEANCPPERLKPIRATKIADEPPPPEPEPAKAVMRDYGYGMACSNCRATRGECHADSCPHAGRTA